MTLNTELKSHTLQPAEAESGDFLNIQELKSSPEYHPSLFHRMTGKRSPAIVFDPDKCTGCSTCEMVCSSRNDFPVSPAAASIRIVRDMQVGKNFAIFCQHCKEPTCMNVCPVHAIAKDKDGIVKIDDKLCVHCGLCAMVCPEAAPLISPRDRTVQKCDLCEGDPLCVKHCPEQALVFTKGKKIGWIRFLRWPVQIASLLLLVIILMGSFCALEIGGFQIACPLGVLQNIASSKTLIAVSVVSGLFLIILTATAGRVFCGWICPFGLILDLVGRVLPQKVRMPSFFRVPVAKYGVLAATIGGSYALNFQAFCAVCPIGTLCRSYGVQGFFKGYELAILPALSALEIGEKRSWCRYFCPVGALLALAAKAGLLKIVIGARKCKKFSCQQCAQRCPMGIIDGNQLQEGISPKLPMNECILCLRCLDQCPYGAVKIRFRWQKTAPEGPE